MFSLFANLIALLGDKYSGVSVATTIISISSILVLDEYIASSAAFSKNEK